MESPDPDAPLHPFALSHHRVAERDRCYRLSLRGRPIFFCARCLGIFVAFGPALVAHACSWLDWFERWPAFFVLVLPIPAVLDWSAGRLGCWDKGNLVRTATGVLLGIAQAAAYYVVVTDPSAWWLWIGGVLYSAVVIMVHFVAVQRARHHACGQSPFRAKAE